MPEIYCKIDQVRRRQGVSGGIDEAGVFISLW